MNLTSDLVFRIFVSGAYPYPVCKTIHSSWLNYINIRLQRENEKNQTDKLLLFYFFVFCVVVFFH